MDFSSQLDNITKLCDSNKKLSIFNFTKESDNAVISFNYNMNNFDFIINNNNFFINSVNKDILKLNIKLFLKNNLDLSKILIKIIKVLDNKSISYLSNIWDINSFNKWDSKKSILKEKDKIIREQFKDINNDENLLFKPNDIFSLVFNEIKHISEKKNWEIDIFDENIYNISAIYKVDSQSKHKSIVDEFCFKIDLNPVLFPFVPPNISLIKPTINSDLSNNFHLIEFLKQENWNPSNTLEFVLDSFEYIIENYFIVKKTNEKTELEKLIEEIQKLNSIEPPIINEIKINFNKIQKKSNQDGKYWNSGVGYGTDDVKTKWKIATLIEQQNNKLIKLEKIYSEIIPLIETNEDNELNLYLLNIINNKLFGIGLTDIDNEKKIYSNILEILKLLETKSSSDIFNNICCNLKNINAKILDYMSFNKSIDDETQIIYQQFIDIGKIYLKYDVIQECLNENQEFCKIMKELQYGSYSFCENKVFPLSKELEKSKITKSCVIKFTKELTDLRNSLPLNPESTIWFKYDTHNLNCVKFMISGPKDTPYQNGLFLFSAFIPDNYPNSPPIVHFETTGGYTIRFNPNLYESGKVCLSLLGTWTGNEDAGEKWNSKTSTFLQVLISIQSLILVENPYFNEPGYEKSMNTENGKSKSFDYNDYIRLFTLKYAIYNYMKNPPLGFEEICSKFFEIKKDEIFKQMEVWSNETRKNKLKYKEIVNLINE
jgi:ubiquitin-protein ligase